ncbi:MAG: hypothetical protein JWM72_2247 [Actinomycetia bacterium]|nr:hypothetical protein [Actinomycetes bacterium]
MVPVSVPCDCPTARITPPPSGEDAPAAATRAALAWATQVRNWTPGAGRLTAVYKVGDTTTGQYGAVFAGVVQYCGAAVVAATWAVELGDPTVFNTGNPADVVVAHFANGWQVWGSYHP